ncbi:hypothetical protein [Paraburkholderia lycopersici]|uniref:Uncharacterized protein n=1 Tax=Paraburkholderia lycopersici TaxID=416944 RepID=A0A1G7ANJ1_9BURK|nr:hypothetical protein [Paraburkholderia lycopersici]SDE16438.1 hypothetical protein SAMN05421548_13513 [Paraburkholderia lycopersici]
MDVFIEPLPRGQWGPIDGYSLEFVDGSKFTNDIFRSEALAASEAILRGYTPLLPTVRITDKLAVEHWKRPEALKRYSP